MPSAGIVATKTASLAVVPTLGPTECWQIPKLLSAEVGVSPG